MNLIKTGAIGTVISLACCFGALGILLGALGLTGVLAYVNNYGDYVFFPALAIFLAMLIIGYVLRRKNK